LKQNLASPLTVEKQIAIIYLGTNNLMKEIPVNKVRAFQEDFFNTLENSHKELLDSLSKKALDEVAPALVEVANHVMKNYMN
jgi:F-type H+-transporting ATPase subunit alpha